MTELTTVGPLVAWDVALNGHACEVIHADGRVVPMTIERWLGDCDAADHALVVNRCEGPTLDVGCGVGRVTEALAARGVQALGIDISPEAVRAARGRGAEAVLGNVFHSVPSSGEWEEALLVDGNIGIGGDPIRLLKRLRRVVRPAGAVLSEVAAPGTGVVHDTVQLRVRGQVTEPFAWSWVGADAIAEVALQAGFAGCEVHEYEGRYLARLTREATS